jgi:predicted PurR-regulated permease PerM
MKQNHNNNHKVIETVLTLILVFLVLAVCIMIISPFLISILWAVIIAIAVFPVYDVIVRKMKGRRIFPAVLVTLLMLAFIFLPVILFVQSAASNIEIINTYLHSGEVNITTPSLKIKSLPLVGEQAYNFLLSISQNIEAAFQKYYPQILNASKVLLGGVLSAAMTFLQLLLSVIIAGVLLATKGTGEASQIFFNRMAGKRGPEFRELCVSTIRNVVKGVLGVAVIQSVLAGIGLFFAGIPYAGVLTIVCLVLAILQIGPGIVILGAIIFLFYTHSTTFAVVWTIYFVGVTFIDNILKPLLLGKGAPVPMLVIFLGVIGGFILYGFIGLFAGPIILSIGYKLIIAWMYPVIETDHELTAVVSE